MAKSKSSTSPLRLLATTSLILLGLCTALAFQNCGQHLSEAKQSKQGVETEPEPEKSSDYLLTLTPSVTPVTRERAATFNVNIKTIAGRELSGEIKYLTYELADGARAPITNKVFTIGVVAEANNSVIVRATLYSGIELQNSYSWFVDSVSPIIEITEAPAARSGNRTNVIKALISDASSTFKTECQLNGAAFKTCTLPVTYTNQPDGTYSFAIRATDAVGNSAVSNSVTWQIDNSAPQVTFIDTPKAFINNVQPSFQFKAFLPSGSIPTQCKLDSAAFSDCTSPLTTSTLTAGRHTFSVRGVRLDGIPTDPIVTSFTVDLSPPTLVTVNSNIIGAPDNRFTNLQAISIAPVSRDDFGIASVSCLLDDKDTTDCTQRTEYKDLLEGSHTVKITPKDKAGNAAAAPAEYTFFVDRTSPQITKHYAFMNPTIHFVAAATDNVAVSLQPKLNFDIVVDSLITKTQSLDPAVFNTLAMQTAATPGAHVATLQVRDMAGNSVRGSAYAFDTSMLETLSETPLVAPVSNLSSECIYFANYCYSAIGTNRSLEVVVVDIFKQQIVFRATSPSRKMFIRGGMWYIESQATDKIGFDYKIFSLSTPSAPTLITAAYHAPNDGRLVSFETDDDGTSIYPELYKSLMILQSSAGLQQMKIRSKTTPALDLEGDLLPAIPKAYLSELRLQQRSLDGTDASEKQIFAAYLRNQATNEITNQPDFDSLNKASRAPASDVKWLPNSRYGISIHEVAIDSSTQVLVWSYAKYASPKVVGSLSVPPSLKTEFYKGSAASKTLSFKVTDRSGKVSYRSYRF